MKNLFKGLLALIVGLFVVVVSLQSLASPERIDEQLNLATLISTPVSAAEIKEPVNIDEWPFIDNAELYQLDEPGSIVTVYVTVRMGNPSDNTHHTWEEINSSIKWIYGSFEPTEVDKAEAIVQFGDEKGPIPGELGYGEVVSNATIQIRGASTSRSPQKSYKIELRNRAGEWRGQRTIALNKHVFDFTRVKNKLSFDLMKEIPHLVSLRTQFFHLYVKDETSDPPSDVFVDYGLFTQVEQPNRRFLQNHLLDGEGQLYKAQFFEFYRYPEKIRLADDPLYDEDQFSTLLEIKGNRDHSKLIQMLDDVNNHNIPIEQTIEKYFDKDNYLTWLAFNILVGNLDTQSQNFYLYSPKNGQKWYFIPWDYDGAFSRQQRETLKNTPYEYWEYGVANYWGVVLHNRALRVENIRSELELKMQELLKNLTPERISSMLEIYRAATEPFLFRMPDEYYLPATKNMYDLGYDLIPTEVENNYELYKLSLQSPMPFYLGTPRIVDDIMIFNWEEAYSFDAQDTEYNFVVSKDWAFQDVVYETTLTSVVKQEIELLEPGTYFWRVVATNEDGFVQYPFDYYFDAEGNQHSGMKYLYITKDGQVLEDARVIVE